MKADESIRSYIHDQLMPEVISRSCPRAISLASSFRKHLESAGMPNSVADERQERWRSTLLYQLEERLSDFERLGIPRPLDFLDDEETLVTWTHPRYEELTGLHPVHSGFVDAYELVGSLDAKMFLVLVTYLLYDAGADPIYITDSPGDEGVDCLGRIASGPLRSLCIIVQAKTSKSVISMGNVLAEFGKYVGLPHSEQFRRYMSALGLPNSLDGGACCYMLVANNEFHPKARAIAGRLGILLRSRSQLSQWLAGAYGAVALATLVRSFEERVDAGVTENVALIIRRVLKEPTAAAREPE